MNGRRARELRRKAYAAGVRNSDSLKPTGERRLWNSDRNGQYLGNYVRIYRRTSVKTTGLLKRRRLDAEGKMIVPAAKGPRFARSRRARV